VLKTKVKQLAVVALVHFYLTSLHHVLIDLKFLTILPCLRLLTASDHNTTYRRTYMYKLQRSSTFEKNYILISYTIAVLSVIAFHTNFN